MTTKFTLRIHNDVQEAVNALLSREPEGTSVNYVICKAVLGYAKSIQSDVQETPKVVTPVKDSVLQKWTRQSEPVVYANANPDDDSDPIDYDPS